MIYLGQEVNPIDFLGRESLIQEIQTNLQYRGYQQVVGPALFGKTSLARVIAQKNEDISGTRVIFLDMQRTHGDISIANSLVGRNHASRTILIVDETDVLCAREESFIRWNRLLRELCDSTCQVSTLLVSRRSYDTYCRRHRLEESRPRGNPVFMQPLSSEEGRQLAEKVIRECGVNYVPDRDLDYIEHLAGQHPYLIEIIANILVKAYRNGIEPDYGEIFEHTLLNCKDYFYELISFVRDESDPLEPMLEVLYCAAIAYASKISRYYTDTHDAERLNKLVENLHYKIGNSFLVKSGLVSVDTGNLRPFSPLLTWTLLQSATQQGMRKDLRFMGDAQFSHFIKSVPLQLGAIRKLESFGK